MYETFSDSNEFNATICKQLTFWRELNHLETSHYHLNRQLGEVTRKIKIATINRH